MSEGSQKLDSHTRKTFDDMNIALERFCTEFGLVIINKAVRVDKPLIFCEFSSEIGKIQMFIEKRDDKVTIAAEISQSPLC